MTTTTGWMVPDDMLQIWQTIKEVAPKVQAATVVIMEKDGGNTVYRSLTFPQMEEVK